VTLLIRMLVGVVALLALPVFALEPVVIKFSHVVSPDTPKGKAALRFKDLAETRSKGRIKMEVHPNSTLFGDKEEMEALIANQVQVIAPTVSKFSPLGFSDFEVFDLPYIFPGRDLLRRITDGPVGRDLLKKLEPKGILGLAYWDNGFKVMSANRPLRKPSDFRDLKVRIQPSKVIDAQMRALGAIPNPIPFGQTFKALQDGTVDGTENPPSNLYTQKMHQVQKHVTVSNHGYLGYAVIANKKFWESLPGDLRFALKLSMIDATRYANLISEQENRDALEKVRAAGTSEVYELTVAERDLWRTALMSVHRDMESRVGKDLIQSIYREGQALGYKFKF
jgi:C4-dicarboxylate-binding protein DctP